MYLSKADIENTERIKRLNLINSVTGIKPANLIATKSDDGFSNVAIFSSVVHLGSDPALIGFVMRPQKDNPRDTYRNLLETNAYTINQIPTRIVKNAHYTSARFDRADSEFEKCGLTEEYLFDFPIPFVAECELKIGAELVERIPIKVNNTILIVGKILHLQFPDRIYSETGQLDLEGIDSAGISGLDTYYGLKKIDQFPYAHVRDVPSFS